MTKEKAEEIVSDIQIIANELASIKLHDWCIEKHCSINHALNIEKTRNNLINLLSENHE